MQITSLKIPASQLKHLNPHLRLCHEIVSSKQKTAYTMSWIHKLGFDWDWGTRLSYHSCLKVNISHYNFMLRRLSMNTFQSDPNHRLKSSHSQQTQFFLKLMSHGNSLVLTDDPSNADFTLYRKIGWDMREWL